jgi:hypothetical protein
MLRSILNQARDLLRTRFVDGRPVDQDDVLYGGSKRWKGGATTKNEDGGNRRYEQALRELRIIGGYLSMRNSMRLRRQTLRCSTKPDIVGNDRIWTDRKQLRSRDVERFKLDLVLPNLF